MFSVNCSSGRFDGVQGFVEQILRMSPGGVVGALGDTRDSPTWANNALTRGFFDAIWPATVPTYGSGSSVRRLGDILNHGTLYMMTQVGVGGTLPAIANGEAESELYLWHCYGDPTLQVRINRPLTLATAFSVRLLASGIEVAYPMDGVEITAARESDGAPIGRGTVRDGIAQLDFVEDFDPTAPLRLSADSPDAKPLILTDNLIIDEENAAAGDQALSCEPPPLPTRTTRSLTQTLRSRPPEPGESRPDAAARAGFPDPGFTARIRFRDAAGAAIGTSATKVPPGRLGTVRVPFSFSPNLRLVPRRRTVSTGRPPARAS